VRKKEKTYLKERMRRIVQPHVTVGVRYIVLGSVGNGVKDFKLETGMLQIESYPVCCF
jgi:hypothetical protein